jgi:hypothetical protein
MQRSIIHIFLIIFLVEGPFSSCNDKLPKPTESPADTVKNVSTTLTANDTPPSVNPKRYTDVHCMLLINYPKISYGEYVYKRYSITADKSEFRIEREYRNREKNFRVIPFTKDEKEKYDTIKDSNAKKSAPSKLEFKNFIADHYVSTKETYTVNGTTYAVYKHIDFNCYDPFCASKHGHFTHPIGVTYFSPDYGILISKDDENMQFELLASIREREVPYDLIIAIMKQNKMDERIIATYLGKVPRKNFSSIPLPDGSGMKRHFPERLIVRPALLF